MGCLKGIIRLVLIILAIVGIIAITQGNINFNFKDDSSNKRETLIEDAKDFGDFSGIESDYKLSKTKNFLGYKKMTVFHTPSGQKTAFYHLKKSIKLSDFTDKKIDEDLFKFYSNFENTPISFKNLTITSKGTRIINKKTARYANFEADTVNLPYKQIKGVIGAYEKDGKTFVYLSVREAGKFSYKINNDILDKLKI